MIPQAVRDSCMTGLAAIRRAESSNRQLGGVTAPAKEFATRVYNGWPIDALDAAELIQVHRTLDADFVEGKKDPAHLSVSFMLWGGETAAGWAQQVIEADQMQKRHQPQPVAAVADDTIELSDRLNQIDERTRTALEAAFRVAYLGALRRTTSIAAQRTNRVSKEVQAELELGENGLNHARERLRGSGPHDGWLAVGHGIMARLEPDLEQELAGALDDYAQEAAQIVTDGERAAAEVIEDETGERPPLGSVFAALAGRFAADNLFEWIRLRLAGEREPEDLLELVVPPAVFRDTVSVAAGAAPSALTVARDGSGAVVDQAGEVVESSLASRLLRSLPFRVETEWTWDYGNPAERFQPFEEHQALDGKRFTDQTRAEAVGEFHPGDHFGCRCNLLSRRTLRRNN